MFAATAPLPLPDLTADQIPEIVQLASDTLANRPRNFSNPALPAPSASDAPGEGEGEGVEGFRRRQEATPTSVPAPAGTSQATSSSAALRVPLAANSQLPRGQPLLEDGAAGDPPSVGVTVLVADKASGDAQVNGVSFMQAAQSQLDYLLYGVPRVSDRLCLSVCLPFCVFALACVRADV